MTGAHFHLIVNHLPVAGALFAAFALSWALWRKGADSARFGMVCLTLLGLFAGMAYFSGEPAEEAVEHLPTVAQSYIEKHEDAAWIAFLGAGTSGVIGLLGLLFHRAAAEKSWFVRIGLIVSVVVFGLMAWTANLGGMVRHTEIRPEGAALGSQGADHHSEHND